MEAHDREAWHVNFDNSGSDEPVQADPPGDQRHLAQEGDTATAWASRASVFGPNVDLHLLQLDIDTPIEIEPSSSPTHHHLLFPGVYLTKDQYARVLAVLVEVGIVQAGFASQLDRFGATFLRIKHDKHKPVPQESRRRYAEFEGEQHLWQEDYDFCQACNYDRHMCPGCGESVPHDHPYHTDCAQRLYGVG